MARSSHATTRTRCQARTRCEVEQLALVPRRDRLGAGDLSCLRHRNPTGQECSAGLGKMSDLGNGLEGDSGVVGGGAGHRGEPVRRAGETGSVVRAARCGPRRHGSLDRPARLTNPRQVPEQGRALFAGEHRRIETLEPRPGDRVRRSADRPRSSSNVRAPRKVLNERRTSDARSSRRRPHHTERTFDAQGPLRNVLDPIRAVSSRGGR